MQLVEHTVYTLICYKVCVYLRCRGMLFLRYRFKFFTCFSKNAAKSEVLDFKISRGRIPPDPPTNARSCMHQSA